MLNYELRMTTYEFFMFTDCLLLIAYCFLPTAYFFKLISQSSLRTWQLIIKGIFPHRHLDCLREGLEHGFNLMMLVGPFCFDIQIAF
jgi:hypothetical protein